MKTTLEAKERNLAEVFSDEYLFTIPPYQRPYAWTTEQTTELFDDIMAALSDSSKIEDVAPYFIGSIVLIKDLNSRDAQVVDGQQRLATLTLLFCVLREFTEISSEDIDTFVREQGAKFRKTKNQFRLSLREQDSEFFQKFIQTHGGLHKLFDRDAAQFNIDSQRLLHENALCLKQMVSKLNLDQQTQLVKFLVERCYLVVVSVSDRNHAYRIFSVMNSRGLDLLPVDILKAEIIGEISGTDQQNEYTAKWEHAEEVVGRDSFNDLFSHVRMIYAKSKAKNTLDEFRAEVMSKHNSRELIDDVILPYQEAYSIVSGVTYASASNPNAVNTYLKYLGEIDNRNWIAPAIAFFKSKSGNHGALAKFVKDLERLAYAMFILRHNVNMRIGRYANVLRAIENSTANDLSKSLELSAEEKKSVIETLDGPIYQTQICKPILLRLDNILADAAVTYEHSVVTIEHVLPRTADSVLQWVKSFPDEEQRERWTDKLANLVLLSRRKNSKAQNYDFDTKKNKYFEIKKGGMSNFALTSQVIRESEWTPKILTGRQAALIDVLKKEWELG